MSTFTGFSEEDLKRIKSSESGPHERVLNVRKIDKIGNKPKKLLQQYKTLQKQSSEENIDTAFDNCKLSLKSPNSAETYNEINKENESSFVPAAVPIEKESADNIVVSNDSNSRKSSINTTPDVVRCVDNYTEDDLASHKIKLEELQLKQKLMEEQNKKRKEMLAKALADRTKQTEEEVQRLEKIKKELQILDGQFSQDVAVLRKKIDHACLSYADAEKHYLKIEKEFLQAKINLQKEKERKELLTEHLCALITHNETRKAQKLETLMLELATNKSDSVNDAETPIEETPVIIDGVDERTGKIVEILSEN